MKWESFFVKMVNLLVLVWVMLFFEGFESDSMAIKSQEETDKTIKIGLLIQDNKSVEARNAAEIALWELNANGGLNGRPVKLIVRSMEGPWGTGSKQAVDMIFNEKVWAIVGSHDGRNAHLVEQATTKARVVFLSAWASDPTLSQAFVPWFFNSVPNDRQQAEAFTEEIYNKRKITKVVLVADKGYDSKLASETFLKMSKKMQKQVPVQLYYDNSSGDFSVLIDQINKSKAECIVLLGQAAASAKILEQIQQRNLEQPVFGALSILGENPISNQDLKKYENVFFIAFGNYLERKTIDFQNEYNKEKKQIPGTVAAYAYDSINIIMEAIKKSGFDRDKLQSTLINIQYHGITGHIHFDSKGNRIGKTGLVEIRKGIPVPLKN